ncbi:tyrosine-type recombinase/integrase [Lysinibacillus sp. BSL11]
MTVSQWMDIWFEARQTDLAISTKTLNEQMIRLYIKPILGHYKISNLDYLTYKNQFIDALLKTKSVNTVKSAHGVFNNAINLAVRNEILSKNRFTSMKISKEKEIKKGGVNEEEQLNFLNEDDLKKLLNYLKKADDMTHTALIWTIALTGMRKGEVATLQWNDIYLQKCTINIYATRDYLGHRDAKTKNSVRIVEVDPELWKLLDSYRKKIIATSNDYVFVNFDTLIPIGKNLAGRILNKAYEDKIISKKNIASRASSFICYNHVCSRSSNSCRS